MIHTSFIVDGTFLLAKLHFYYSAMNAGKSTTLLQSSHNYNERGMETLLFAPNIDTRFQPGHISTRIGLNAKATVFFEKTDLYEIIHEVITKNNDIQCVLIDEAQFLKKAQVEQLCRVVDELKIPALTYGLRTDFQGEPFEGSQYLLAWADLLIELKTICHCGHKATMNLRIDQDGNPLNTGEQIQIGGNESYEATCRHHFRLGQSGKRQLKMQLKKNDH